MIALSAPTRVFVKCYYSVGLPIIHRRKAETGPSDHVTSVAHDWSSATAQQRLSTSLVHSCLKHTRQHCSILPRRSTAGPQALALLDEWPRRCSYHNSFWFSNKRFSTALPRRLSKNGRPARSQESKASAMLEFSRPATRPGSIQPAVLILTRLRILKAHVASLQVGAGFGCQSQSFLMSLSYCLNKALLPLVTLLCSTTVFIHYRNIVEP